LARRLREKVYIIYSSDTSLDAGGAYFSRNFQTRLQEAILALHTLKAS